MASLVDYGSAERNVTRYWDDIYHNQDGSRTHNLEQIVSTNVAVNSSVTIDGTTKTNSINSFKNLLPVITQISQAIVKDSNPQLTLTVYQREVENGNLKISYHFRQVLIVNAQQEGDFNRMTSKGTQIWTATQQGLLLSLDVTETDTISEPYDLKSELAATNLTGQDKPVKQPKPWCVLV